MNGLIKKLIYRIYEDYLMPSRLLEYEDILLMAKKHNYEIIGVKEFYIRVCNDHGNQGKYFVFRHDIDTDISTTKIMFLIEKKHNVRTSYYFRLSTLDLMFVKEVIRYGSEIGYHYEELSTYAKRHNIKDKDNLIKNLDKIREEFKRNLKCIEKITGNKIETIASHGDWINRKLGIINCIILEDKKIRDECNILCECYDKILLDRIDCCITDKPPPEYYYPMSPIEAIDKGYKKIYFLCHPRHWRTNWKANTKGNIIRIIEEIKWKIGL